MWNLRPMFSSLIFCQQINGWSVHWCKWGVKVPYYYFIILLSLSLFMSVGICLIFHFSSVAQSCLTLGNPMNCSTPGLPVHHQLPECTQLMSIESVMPSSHLILCHPLLLLPLIPPSIRAFSNESTLHMRWPKYWSFSFSISRPNFHFYDFLSPVLSPSYLWRLFSKI